MTTTAWSANQTAIFETVQTTDYSIIIDAVAGSGKTTTLVELFRRLSNTVSSLFLAFGKDIAKELGSRMKDTNVDCKTFHALCMGALIRAYNIRNVSNWLNPSKTWDLLKRYEVLLLREQPEARAKAMMRVLGAPAKRLVGLAKQVGVGIPGMVGDTPEAWMNIWNHHGLDFDYKTVRAYGHEYTPDMGDLITMARWLLNQAVLTARSEIDFDDMIYMVLRDDVKLRQYDVVGIDEAQDTNPVRRKVALKSLRPGGRIIAVGDERQAIFGFTGADAQAMNLLEQETGAVRMPLSVTYRCARAIVEKAQEIVPHIEAAPNAIKGSVSDDFLGGKDRPADFFKGGGAVLCRNTQPLVKLAYRLIKGGVGAKILGRDIGAGLVTLIEKFNRKTLDELQDRAEKYRDAEVEKYTKAGDDAAAGAIDDKVGSLLVLIDMMPEGSSIKDLIAQIENLFSDKVGGGVVTLSTVHKAKGLEWNKVFVLKPELFPSRFATKDWQLEQEDNLLYVAYTRALRELVLLGWDDKGEADL